MKNRMVFMLLFIIIILGGVLRLYRIRELGTFLADQAIELEGALHILQGKFTLIGIKTSNSEVRNGAVMYYLLAPLLFLFDKDPIAGGILQSILSLATVVAAYWLGKNIKNEYTGLLAAFFIAVSPLLVRYSRQTLLAQYPLFFCSLSFVLLVRIEQKFSKITSLILGILLGFILQIHYSTLSVILVSFLFPFMFLKKERWKYLFWEGVGFLIGFAPMIVFELRHEFFNTQMLLKFLTTKQQSFSPSFAQYRMYFVSVFSNLLFPKLVNLVSILMLLMVAYVVKFRNCLKIVEKLAVLYILVSVIFIMAFGKDLIIHYAIASFVPIVILLVGLCVRVFATISKAQKLLFVLFSVGFLLINLTDYGFSDNHGWMMSEGWDLVGTKKASDLVVSDISTYPLDRQYNVVMVVDAQNQGLPLRYFLNQTKRPTLPSEKYDVSDYLYVVARKDTELPSIFMWELTSFGAFQIEKTWPIQNDFVLHRLGKKHV